MKPILLKISPLLNVVPHKAWQAVSKQNIIFPFYHSVDNWEKPYLRYTFPVRTLKQCRDDLDWLMRHYEPISYNQLLEPGTKFSSTKKYFLLSFDDGLKSINNIVAPILKEKSIPAIFFINTGFTDNKDLFFRYKINLMQAELDKVKISR